MGDPQNWWFTMENLIKMDDLGVPKFLGNLHLGANMFLMKKMLKRIQSQCWILWTKEMRLESRV